jgi:tRNA-splicing ligase RtcB
MAHETIKVEGGAPVHMWTEGVPVEPAARQQLVNTAKMPFIYRHIAVMPDVHLGKGSTIGSVIPTLGAVIPAAVGVDIGCGMMAAKTTLSANDLPDNLGPLRSAIEKPSPTASRQRRAVTRAATQAHGTIGPPRSTQPGCS